MKILEDFLCGKTKILISTSVLSYGIDFPNCNLIIHYRIPFKEKLVDSNLFIHRVGRGGRYNTPAKSIMLISGLDELNKLNSLETSLGIQFQSLIF